MPTRQLFNARTQQLENAEFTVDHNNEIVATFADGGIVKFPAGLTPEQFETAIQLHQEHNTGQVVITPEYEAAKVAERAASEALINSPSTQPPVTAPTNDGNTMPAGDQTNVPAADNPAP